MLVSAAYVGAFVVAACLSALLTWSVREESVRHKWFTTPAVGRHIHQGAIPRLGGVAIFTSLITVLLLLLAAKLHFKADAGFSPQTIFHILLPATLIFVLGLLDDFCNLNARIKFSVQVVAGAWLYFGGIGIRTFESLRIHHLPGVVALLLTVLWVVWITNAFNLIDGLDGLAAGSALFSTTVVFVVAAINRNHLVGLTTLALAGAIVGFLRFNFSPATIFLGDCGSLFIGFMLSALALAGSHKSSTIVAIAIPVVSFGLPVLDVGVSIVRRFLAGKPLFTADADHIHHRLLKRGLTHRGTVIALYGASAVFALFSLLLLVPVASVSAIVLLVLVVAVGFGIERLGYAEFAELVRIAQRTIEQKRVVVNNLAIRRASEAFSRCSTFEQICGTLETALQENDFCCFELRIETSGDSLRQSPEERVHSWYRSGVPPDGVACWRLQLQLLTNAGESFGTFTLECEQNGQPLMLDMNLLTAKFQQELARSLCVVLAPKIATEAAAAVAAGTAAF